MPFHGHGLQHHSLLGQHESRSVPQPNFRIGSDARGRVDRANCPVHALRPHIAEGYEKYYQCGLKSCLSLANFRKKVRKNIAKQNEEHNAFLVVTSDLDN